MSVKYYIDTEFNEVTREKFEDELREYINEVYGFTLVQQGENGITVIRKDKIDLERTDEQKGRLFARIMDMINKHYA